ncbi:Monocarboxylate transporter 14 [Lamellibrachia satsuma]|nr:Monocarboxylate transporter 14 [Lamellibrachia satsuma]
MREGYTRKGDRRERDMREGYTREGCFTVNFAIVGGCTGSFGILLPEISERFNASATQVAWLPAIANCLRLLIATPANVLATKIGTRWVVVIGSLFVTVGFSLCTIAHQVEVLYITFGCMVGVGAGLCYAPSVVILGQYFDKRRALANGLSFCGAGLGAFVLPPVLRYCVDSYELNTAFFLFAACTFQVSIAGMLFRPPQFYVKRYILRQSRLAQAKPPNTATSVLKTTSNDYAAMDSTPQRHWGFGWMLLCNPLMWLYAITFGNMRQQLR